MMQQFCMECWEALDSPETSPASAAAKSTVASWMCIAMLTAKACDLDATEDQLRCMTNEHIFEVVDQVQAASRAQPSLFLHI